MVGFGPGMKILKGENALLWGLAVLTLLIARSGISAGSPTMRLGYTAISPTQSIAWIAHDEGLFKKNGLAVEIVYTRGGATTIQSLLAGDQQVAQVGGAAALSAMLKGADLVFIALLVRNFYYEFIVGPEIKQITDLKGKRVAVSGFGNITHIATLLLLNKYQLAPNRDVAIVRVGGLPEAMAALLSGGVHGAVLTAPFNAQAIRAGARKLLTMKDENIAFPLNTVVVKKTDLEKNRNNYLAILRAFLEAISFLKTNKNRSTGIIKKYMRIADPLGLELAYEEALNTVDDPYVHQNDIQNALQLIASINNVGRVPPASAVIDNSLLDEARKGLGMPAR